jgi:hypothetical protein
MTADPATPAAKAQKTPAATLTTASVTLTDAEVNYLIQMREEEKLARDVYITISQKYADPIFSKIAESEQQHFAAIGTLIARYGVADPAAHDTVGSFTVQEFADLYAQLTAQGAGSLTSAMNVGVTIETMDIADLRDALAATSRRDITRVSSNLLLASMSHLQAFLSHL